MKLNDPQNLKRIAENFSPDQLAEWLGHYLCHWQTNDPPFSAPRDQAEPGSFLGSLLDSLSSTWDSPTHKAFANAAFILFDKWDWKTKKFPLPHEEKTFIEDILYFLEKYPTGFPENAANRLWESLEKDSLDDNMYARTMLAYSGQLHRMNNPMTHLMKIGPLRKEVELERAMVPAFSCLLAIERTSAMIINFPGVVLSLKKRGRSIDNLLCEVAIHHQDDEVLWQLTLMTLSGTLGEYEKEIIAELKDCYSFVKEQRKKRRSLN